MFRVVTTMNEAGWIETGKRLVQSYQQHWPKTVPLTIYAEKFQPEFDGEVRELPLWLKVFKKRLKHVPSAHGQHLGRYTFKMDAVKFAHKVAALTDFALSVDDGSVIIWLDADTFTHSPVTEDWLVRLFPSNVYMAWLDRFNNHPECGFMMFRSSHPYHQTFMERFRDFYVNQEVLKLPETHDSYALQHLVNFKVKAGKIEQPFSLSGDAKNWSHPFCAGPLGECLDHMKGARKQQGRSPRIDARGRKEYYWTR